MQPTAYKVRLYCNTLSRQYLKSVTIIFLNFLTFDYTMSHHLIPYDIVQQSGLVLIAREFYLFEKKNIELVY